MPEPPVPPEPEAPPVRIAAAEPIWEATRIWEAESVEEVLAARSPLGQLGATISWAWRLIGSGGEWLFGLASLIAGLAIISAIPVVQILTLGYLMEATGRVARSGRLRDGLVGVRKAARVGSLVLGTWLLLLPLRQLSAVWRSAELIDPGSLQATRLRAVLLVMTVLLVGQILWAWFRGGRLRDFFWPAPIRFARRLFQGGKYVQARDATWEFLASLRLPHYFWLGVRGFAGTVVWLFLPVMLFIAGTAIPNVGGVLLGLVGAGLLSLVLLYLPFLQAEFAADNQLVSLFDIQRVRLRFRQAPVAFWTALLAVLLLSLPLYLLKIELTYQEVTVLPALVFVVFIFPARLLTGWAVGRARRRETPRHWFFRWTARLAGPPLAFAYVFFLFFTRYTSWYGHWSLFEQPALLLPAPFMG